MDVIGFVKGNDGADNLNGDTKWVFFKAKFDNLSLFIMISAMLAIMMWADIHSSDKFLSWLEQTATTVLGAYIGLTQASRAAWNKNGGSNGNGATTATSSISSTPSTNVSVTK
jgi:hypothetical protein